MTGERFTNDFVIHGIIGCLKSHYIEENLVKKLIPLAIAILLLCLTAQSWAAPAAPTMTYKTNGLGITVTWTKVPEATNYTLYYATHPFMSGGFVGSSDRGNETSFSVELPANASYYIAVRAKNESGESDYSNIEHFTIEMPTVSSFNDLSIYKKNGLLENIQVLLLSLSCIIIIYLIVYQKRADKLFLSLFFLTCLTFILREIDVEDLNIPSIISFIIYPWSFNRAPMCSENNSILVDLELILGGNDSSGK